MTAVTNYGSLFTFSGVTVFKCIVTDFPEISTTRASTTNHSSGGFAEGIPSGLITLGDFTLSALNESGVLGALRTYMVNKTVATGVLTNGIDTLTGSCFILSVKPEPADAEDPQANKMTVVVSPTGSWTAA